MLDAWAEKPRYMKRGKRACVCVCVCVCESKALPRPIPVPAEPRARGRLLGTPNGRGPNRVGVPPILASKAQNKNVGKRTNAF